MIRMMMKKMMMMMMMKMMMMMMMTMMMIMTIMMMMMMMIVIGILDDWKFSEKDIPSSGPLTYSHLRPLRCSLCACVQWPAR